MIFNYKKKEQVVSKIKEILDSKEKTIISGGNTIKYLLKNYNGKIYNKKILISDERLVNVNSKLRNDLFFKKLVKKKILKAEQIISYKYGEFDHKKIINFSNKIKRISFSNAILSLGSKGHFASIFHLNKEINDFYFINNSEKFPKKRVTVSLKKILKCKKIFFLASRKKRADEIKNFKKNKLIKQLGMRKVSLITF